jgi:hypothetical protein
MIGPNWLRFNDLRLGGGGLIGGGNQGIPRVLDEPKIFPDSTRQFVVEVGDSK